MTRIRSLRFGRNSRTAALLIPVLLTAPAVAFAQDTGTAAMVPFRGRTALSRPLVLENVASTDLPLSAAGDVRTLRNLFPPRILHDSGVMADRAPSLSRHLLVGSGIGAAAGTAFGVAVVALADCGGANCSEERVVGVAGHALAGAVVGALVGGVTYLIRR